MLNFQCKNDCKGHQMSNLEWYYIKIYCHQEYCLCRKFHTCITNSTGLVLCRSTIYAKVILNEQEAVIFLNAEKNIILTFEQV